MDKRISPKNFSFKKYSISFILTPFWNFADVLIFSTSSGFYFVHEIDLLY